MAKYTFKLNRYEIKHTRSRHKDTNYITAALSVNGTPVGSPRTKFMGDQNDGSYPVDFSWPGVEVLQGGSVVLLYQILNSGHKDHADLERALTTVAETALTSQVPTPWTGELVRRIGALVFANCDGPIGPPEGRKVVWHDFELKGMAPGTTGEDLVNEHGSDSSWGCGKNSHYIVHVSVTA